ncbi:MAG: hypothetical protein J6C38_08065 [Oscillospiraceae bacterium]|nr:hypothetical protein [Oscillospiraceae bacterium]
MKFGKRIISAITAGLCVFSAFSGIASPLTINAFAADTQKTFDGKYNLTDKVNYYSYFRTENTAEIQDDLDAVFEKVCQKEISKITYGDLKKITTLNLSGMELEDIPKCIMYMENLRTLNLSLNNLRYENNVLSLNLSALKKLNTLDVSWNYLSKVPSWYVLDGISNKYINHNLLSGDDQRYIKARTPVYYFMDGEKISIEAFKEKILADICFDDGTSLPDFLYDPDSYGSDQPLKVVTDDDGKIPLEDYLNDSGDKIELGSDTDYTSVSVTVQLFSSANNANTKTTIKVFILDGSSPTTAKARLETLFDEIKDYQKEDYTSGSWTNFENAQKTAEAIMKYPNSDAEMLKTALEQLDAAKRSLVLGINPDTKTVLNDLASVGKTYKEEEYTPSSWNVLQKALDRIATILADTNSTLSSAKNAILSFQNAQKNLEKTKLVVPNKILKADFTKIFGESGKSVSAKGTTRSGRSYSWVFHGTAVTNPADFTPGITDTPAEDSAIMLESGRAGGYLAFSTTQSGDFPGKGKLTINVSDKFSDGLCYYYKWNSTSGSLIGEATVSGGNVTVEVSEGGTYYISTVLQRFDLVSSKLEIDAENHSICVPLCSGYTSSDFKRLFSYASSVVVYDADENPVSGTARIKSGMKASSPNGELYTITVMGDVNDDGYVNPMDALAVLKYSISNTSSKTENKEETTKDTDKETTEAPEEQAPEKKFGIAVTGVNVADVNNDGYINIIDSLMILKAFKK